MKKSKNICIGILGGGQLARMSAFQAIRMGIDVAILEKIKNSPAGMLTNKEYVGWVNDKKLVKEFAKNCDLITLENEFIDSHILTEIENLGKKVLPSPATIGLIQDKYIQKKTLAKKGIPVPDFFEVKNLSDYSSLIKKLGNKFVLKSRKMGYDGYGNALIRSESDFNTEFFRLTKRHSELYAEKFVDFKKELAIMIVRNSKEINTYPVVETIQKDHICHTVLAPAQITDAQIKLAKEIGVQAVRAVKGRGIFGIEFFLTKSGEILVNEMAPRPHNSGHYTIEACVTSQFENHIRSVLDLPLGSTDLVQPFAVMINLLGKKNDSGIIRDYRKVLEDSNVHLHIYGKKQSRIGRKMGHITMLGNDLKKILSSLRKTEKNIII